MVRLKIWTGSRCDGYAVAAAAVLVLAVAAGVGWGLIGDDTDRELDVLALVAQGRTDREIATELFISRKTASLHVSSILRKVGATNRVDAATIAGDLATRRRRRGNR